MVPEHVETAIFAWRLCWDTCEPPNKKARFALRVVNAFLKDGTQLPTSELIELGDRCIAIGELGYALCVLKLLPAGAERSQKLAALGLTCLQNCDFYKWAREAFEEAGCLPPPGDLQVFANACVKKRLMDDAMAAYATLGIEPPRKVLILFGKWCLTKRHYSKGLRAFRKAEYSPTQKELIGCCVRLRTGSVQDLEEFVAAIKDCGFSLPKEGIIALGAYSLRNCWIESGLHAYRVAESRPSEKQLVDCGVKCLKKGYYQSAIQAFAEAGISPPSRLLVKCARILLARGKLNDALEAFKLAGVEADKKLLVDTALVSVEEQDLQLALRIFDKLRQLGQTAR